MYEKKRTAAYNDHLRWRIVWKHGAEGKSQVRIAEELCVDKSTVSRMLKLFSQTGKVKKRAYPKEKSYRKLTKPAQLLILQPIQAFLKGNSV